MPRSLLLQTLPLALAAFAGGVDNAKWPGADGGDVKPVQPPARRRGLATT